MRIDFMLVPYDLGKRGVGMGQGPARILTTDVANRLREMGHSIRERTIAVPSDEDSTDIQLTFQLNRVLSREVARSVREGAFPIVLAGNCITTVGTLSGVHSQETNVLWLDAHGDFNTPETTQSGYLDGMALSVVCGNCWGKVAATDPLYLPIPEKNVFLVGARDLDPDESEALRNSHVTISPSEQLRRNDFRIVELDDAQVRELYIHLDADIIDARVGRANCFASEGGLFPNEIERLFSWVCRRHRVTALAITAYNPDFDHGRTIEGALSGILIAVVEAISDKDSAE